MTQTKPEHVESSSQGVIRLVNLPFVCEHFNLSRRAVLYQVEKKLFPKPCRVGRQLRWPVPELNSWIEAGCPPVSE